MKKRKKEDGKMKRMRSGFLRFLTDRRGAMAVEFGMIAMAFLTTVFGTVDGGRALWAKSAMQSALDDTSRYALTHRDATDSTLQSYAQSRMKDIYYDSSSGLTVTVSRSTTNGVDYIKFAGSYVFKTLIPFLPSNWSALTLTGTSQTPIPAVAYAPPSSSSSGTDSGSGTNTGTNSGTNSGTSSSADSNTGTSTASYDDGSSWSSDGSSGEESCAHGHSCSHGGDGYSSGDNSGGGCGGGGGGHDH